MEFQARESRVINAAIDAYNEALEILSDYLANARSAKSDIDKSRRLLKCLDIIGKIILWLYMWGQTTTEENRIKIKNALNL